VCSVGSTSDNCSVSTVLTFQVFMVVLRFVGCVCDLTHCMAVVMATLCTTLLYALLFVG